MRGPTKTPEHLESERIFAEVKKAKGLEGKTVLDPEFRAFHLAYTKVCRAGMSAEQIISAMEA